MSERVFIPSLGWVTVTDDAEAMQLADYAFINGTSPEPGATKRTDDARREIGEDTSANRHGESRHAMVLATP